MEYLEEALATSFSVSNDKNNTSAPHPRFSQYKMKCNVPDQTERRQRILKLQKTKRFDFLNHVRNLSENIWGGGSYKNDNSDGEFIDYENGNGVDDPGFDQSASFKPGRYYKNQLMLSEWMLEVPEHFETDWLMLLSPIGKRCLVVASYGSTKVFARSGYFLYDFPTLLPGGSEETRKKFNERVILDCIYSEVKQTFYILDLMCWNDQQMYDAETEFRFYWLKNRLEEEAPGIDIYCETTNQYPFVMAPKFDCSRESIGHALNKSTVIDLDGILFYHKKTHYIFGSNPLVLWLKAYMVPEILGIPVTEELLSQAPDSYVNFRAHQERMLGKKETYRLHAEERNKSRLAALEAEQKLVPGYENRLPLDSNSLPEIVSSNSVAETARAAENRRTRRSKTTGSSVDHWPRKNNKNGRGGRSNRTGNEKGNRSEEVYVGDGVSSVESYNGNGVYGVEAENCGDVIGYSNNNDEDYNIILDTIDDNGDDGDKEDLMVGLESARMTGKAVFTKPETEVGEIIPESLIKTDTDFLANRIMPEGVQTEKVFKPEGIVTSFSENKPEGVFVGDSATKTA